MTSPFDRRRLLRAGGALSLGALLAACSSADRTTATPATSTPAGPSPTPGPTTAAPPPPAATDLLARTSTCVLTPETIAGPTWFDAHAVRSDVRENRPGTPLDLAFRVVTLPACTPVPQAVVDLWQCDAAGVYSGFAAAGPGDGGTPGGHDEYGDKQSRATDPETWLRGTQVTDADGIVRYSTVYPGWYPTRTAHLHLKVHLSEKTVLTTQLFFDDAISDAVYAAGPYAGHPGRDTRNRTDHFFSAPALLTLAPAGPGWLGAITLGVR